jgi:hypothetical protein
MKISYKMSDYDLTGKNITLQSTESQYIVIRSHIDFYHFRTF